MEKIKEIPDESIDCIVTSPPYWGLRDYKVEGQWGLEKSFSEWLDKMLLLTNELKRVLKKSGTFWLNIGDTYAGSGKGFYPGHEDESKEVYHFDKKPQLQDGVPTKCLTMIPERLATRMIDEQQWILRNKIIWHKPNAMPASIRDRLKNSYEVVYLFVKNKKYWFDLDAIRVPAKNPEDDIRRIKADQQKLYNLKSDQGMINQMRITSGKKQDNVPSKNASLYKGFNQRWKETQEFKEQEQIEKDKKYGEDPNNLGRKAAYLHTVEQGTNIAGSNPGDVWTIATQPFSEAHFATFPEKLIEPMIRAGCPNQICSKCGFIRERITKALRGDKPTKESKWEEIEEINMGGDQSGLQNKSDREYETIGWTKCNCNTEWLSGVCLDPFGGSGTVAVVAQKLNRSWILIELKEEYCKMARERIYKKSEPITNFTE